MTTAIQLDGERLAVSVEEAARLLGVSRGKMYPLVMAGQIESFTIGTRRLIPTAALRRFVEEQAGNPRGGGS
ncbi:MAG: helix-turn-helix domain-containing protein [Tepidiformaceae bacterium]